MEANEQPNTGAPESTAKPGSEERLVLRPPETFECEMCGNWFPDSRMNYAEDVDGSEHELCNSCYWNSGY